MTTTNPLNSFTERWRVLLLQVKTTFELTDELNLVSEEQFSMFEKYLEFKLPKGYKEFCFVFGQGCFNKGFLCIHCPRENAEIFLASHQEILDATKSLYPQNLDLKNLLESSYLIGLGPQTLFVFNLKTYDSEDESYDIYAIDEDGKCYGVGRDFYDFIENFCVTQVHAKQFPDLLKSMGSGDVLLKKSNSPPPEFTPIL
jgi:hypothetical protein